jgi:hypothetical protein
MILALNFNTNAPSPYRFLERLIKLSKSDDLVLNYAHYLVEITLTDMRFYKYEQSLIASAGLYLAKKLMRRQKPWNDFME